MDIGSVICLSAVMILLSALMTYLARRTVEKRLREEQMRAAVARTQAADKRHDAMLQVLKWVHQVHQAVYFAEISAQRVLPGKPDNLGWEELANKLDALGPCPPQSSLLPETLRYMVLSIEPNLAELKSCVARHRESLGFIPYDKSGISTLSATELQAARSALAEDVQEKARPLNIFMETVEKHFDAAFFAPLDVRLHRGRNESPTLPQGSPTSKRPDDLER